MSIGIRTDYRAAIIGAGPAGLAAAAGLLRAGVTDFILIEREPQTGGILNQCIHNGFGLKYYKQDLTGPEFALRLKQELRAEIERLPAGIAKAPSILCSAMVSRTVRKDGAFELMLHSKGQGIRMIRAGAVITTTGCRERTRENIEVPGTRPAGVFTAGQAQNLINLRHYSPGSRAVIQGSGDIGLIMARRLTIEGIKVTAVFERLPYLSGSIRNKVQCLDHFGIPLYLGRQITDIRGGARVSSVETAAVDAGFSCTAGTDKIFRCDTVLFAAGLIPELETIKTAGVELPDGFHPSSDICFETNTRGIFTAGNCLHINDLADTAAEEGLRAAAAAVDFLQDTTAFRKRSEAAPDGKPYQEPEPRKDLNEAYFRKISDEKLVVCIVCPKGCLISEGDYGCRRGEDYFIRTYGPANQDGTTGLCQRIHTTVECCGGIIPAVSVDEIPVRDAREIIILLKDTALKLSSIPDNVDLIHSEKGYRFSLCIPEKLF